ncbi:hypothetical protein HY230_05900 [Candidatus Acetothermia bacterium]|nr:hypothetical protein [Candidatus Acetothermia bacterium]
MLRICYFSALVAAVIGATAVGLMQSGPAPDRQPAPVIPVYVVEMRDNYFDPPGLFLQLGDSVTWVLSETAGNSGHSATAYHPSQDKELRIPEAAQPFNSDVFKKLGNRFTFKFTVSGVYDYFCIPHEDVGMVGRIIVKEATGPGTKPLDQGVSVAGQSIMPTIDEVLGLNGQLFNFLARLNAVLFLTQQNHRDQATIQLKLLRQDWESGINKPSSVYESLKSVGFHEDFNKQLLALEDAFNKNSPTNAIQDLVQKAKEILNKAMSKLSQGKS